MLAHKNNNTAEALEVTQMTFFKYAIGNTVVENISDAGSNTELTSFMGVTLVDGELPEDADLWVYPTVDEITAENANAKVLVPGATVKIENGALTEGQTTDVKVVVTSKDGSAKKTYTLSLIHI